MIMPIGSAPISPISPLPSGPTPNVTGASGDGTSFSDLLSGVVKEANVNQAKADEAVKKLASGENTDVHQVMLAMEQARLSLMMVVDVRNKMVEAYQELSRMPV